MEKLSSSVGMAVVLFGALVCTVVCADEWSENFDAYETGSPLDGQGGWTASPPDGVIVTDDEALSEPNALSIVGDASDGDDALYVFEDFPVTDGVWTIGVSQHIPGGSTGSSYFILLSEFNFGGAVNWATQLEFDTDAGTLVSDFDGSEASLHLDEWVTLRVLIDLDRDVQRVIYGDDVVVTKSWSEGVSGSGPTSLAAVNLFGNCCGREATEFYYDDFSLCETCPADVNGSGAVDFGDILEVLAAWGPCAPGPCWYDLDADGVVGFSEILDVLATWGACG